MFSLNDSTSALEAKRELLWDREMHYQDGRRDNLVWLVILVGLLLGTAWYNLSKPGKVDLGIASHSIRNCLRDSFAALELRSCASTHRVDRSATGPNRTHCGYASP
jgi:hypothetical protein